MNVSFEKNGNVSGVLTIQIEKADYADNVKKSLKNLRKQAQVPGFRPGHAPAGLVDKRFGAQVKMDEVNKLISDNLFGYIRDNKLNMLGEPLGAEDQEPQDIEQQDDFTFKFDIALAPEFKAELTDKDTVVYYDIEVSDEQVENQVKSLAQQAGRPESFEEYQERDILRGKLVELEGGEPKADGIVVEKASLMPVYFADQEQAKLFEGAKKDGVVTFNLAKAYAGREAEVATILKIEKEEVANHSGDFAFTIDDISRIVPAELNQELFDRIFGEGEVKSEEEFKARIKEETAKQYTSASDFRFLQDARAYVIEKIGKLEFPDALLKRLMLQNNQDKGAEFVDENYDKSIEVLTWQLVKEQLAEANGVKVEDADVRRAAMAFARMQFAQYGMNNIPEEYLEQYAENLLKDRNQVNGFIEQAVDMKLTAALKEVVKLDHKSISMEDFNKLGE